MPTDQQWRAACKHIITRLHHITVLFTHVIIVTTRLLQLKKDPEPYHTSILTGQGWVEELLSGHPEHICCELGVCRHMYVPGIDRCSARAQLWPFKAHHSRGTTHHIPLYVSHWIDYLTCWGMLSVIQQNNISLFSPHPFHHVQPSILH